MTLGPMVAALALVAGGVAPAAAQTAVEYRGTGVVVALMPAPSTDLFRDVKPGDRVTFVLRDTPGALVVISLQRVPL